MMETYEPTSKLSNSPFDGKYLMGTLLMDGGRHLNYISDGKKDGDRLKVAQKKHPVFLIGLLSSTENESNPFTKHVASHEMSKLSKAVLIAD